MKKMNLVLIGLFALCIFPAVGSASKWTVADTLRVDKIIAKDSSAVQMGAFSTALSGKILADSVLGRTDTNTGLVLGGSDTAKVMTAGVVRLKVNPDGTVTFIGNVGVENEPTPSFPIAFPNGTGDKISLWGQSGNTYGFGVQNNLLQVHTDVTGADIAFGYGSSAALTETARITGAGQLQIPTVDVAGGLLIGGDVNLYRASANRLKTDDALTVNDTLSVTGKSILSGIVSVGNGTAALPAIAGINDPNTGLRFGGTDTLGFVTGGSDRMTIVGGNVGFSTTSFGTSAQGVIGVSAGVSPITSPQDMSQVWAVDYNGAGSNRLYTRTEEGQSAPLATLNETAIFYGVTWNESADSYTRTGRTTGHKVAATLPAGMLPIQESMRGCLLNDDGTVNYYLSPTNWAYKEDGATASVLTGADGQVMVEIPKFWYRYGYSGTTHTWEVSPVALAGFAPHPAFYKDGAWVDNRYVGAYEGVLYNTGSEFYENKFAPVASHSATFDVDNGAGKGTITAGSGTPYSWLAIGDTLVITGTADNDGTYAIETVTSTVITCTGVIAGADGVEATTVISSLAADWTATTGDKLSSVSGVFAVTNGTRAQFREIALNRGTGWRQWDYDLVAAIELLCLTEYASFYTQSVIGAGISNVGDWSAYNAYYPIAKTGTGNAIGNATGNTAGSTTAAAEVSDYVKYRGIEQWYGHLWKFVDGLNINGNIPYRCNVETSFADDTASNYVQMVNVLGAGVTLHNADGYVATLQKMKWGFLPASVGADGSTKITDYYWQNAGWRVALFGGASSYGANDGGFCWSLLNASSFAYPSFCARVAY